MFWNYQLKTIDYLAMHTYAIVTLTYSMTFEWFIVAAIIGEIPFHKVFIVCVYFKIMANLFSLTFDS